MTANGSFEVVLREQWNIWFANTALPFWRKCGWLDDQALALERLNLAGQPDYHAPRRVRTQARQVFSFAEAARLGLDPAGHVLALRTFEALATAAHASDGSPGWVHVLSPSGRTLDARRDLYDHAFVLLMLASLLRLDDAPHVRRSLDATIDVIDSLFAAPHGGYAEDDRGSLPRRQNPHMHLFEAWLALYEATGEARFLARAGELWGLFRSRFFDEDAGVLREFFREDWQLLPAGGSATVEPGHF